MVRYKPARFGTDRHGSVQICSLKRTRLGKIRYRPARFGTDRQGSVQIVVLEPLFMSTLDVSLFVKLLIFSVSMSIMCVMLIQRFESEGMRFTHTHTHTHLSLIHI